MRGGRAGTPGAAQRPAPPPRPYHGRPAPPEEHPWAFGAAPALPEGGVRPPLSPCLPHTAPPLPQPRSEPGCGQLPAAGSPQGDPKAAPQLLRRTQGRPTLTAAAASSSRQHPKSSTTKHPAAGLRLRHRGSILAATSGGPGAGVRRGHSPARVARLAPSSIPRPPRRHRPPLCRARPLLPAQVLPRLLALARPARFIRATGGPQRVCGEGVAPRRVEGAVAPRPPLPARPPRFGRRGFGGTEAGSLLPLPAASSGGRRAPDYFSRRRQRGV